MQTPLFSYNAALHELVGHEVTRVDMRDDEIWFCIGEHFIRFSKYEYVLVTGLRFGGSIFNLNKPHVPHINGVYMLSLHGQNLTMERLRKKFGKGAFRASASNALKVAKVLIVSCLLFGVEALKARLISGYGPF
ncbi:hypothetical protein PTKIN_Ptkin03bG0180500 [Pterospermum kingtungense]